MHPRIAVSTLILFALTACTNGLTPSDRDLREFEQANQIGYEEVVSTEQDLCGIVRAEEIAEILNSSINLAEPIRDVPISCHYQNTEAASGVAMIVLISQENKSVIDEYEDSEVFFDNIQPIDDFEGNARIVDSTEASHTMDFLRKDIWVNMTITGGSPEMRVEQGKSIASLVFERI